MAAPMPRLDPVTTATFPRHAPGISVLPSVRTMSVPV